MLRGVLFTHQLWQVRMRDSAATKRFRPGDWVRVRTAEEIFASLDDRGELAGLPFMPEMLAMAGRRFRVLRCAEAVCATDDATAIRRLRDCVHLEDVNQLGLRCDGSSHGGCQSNCLLFWHEAWLETSSPSDAAASTSAASGAHGLLPILENWSKQNSEWSEEIRYRCQATQLWQATEQMPNWDPRQYLRAVVGNRIPLRRVFGGVLGSLWQKVRKRLARNRRRVPKGRRTPQQQLKLQVGELVEVRPASEIHTTLDRDDKNRGLWFDPQMEPYCGRRFRVADRIERIIDEATGRMVQLKSPAVTLDSERNEAVTCDGCWHRFCSREAPLFWREIWLQRVEPAPEERHPPAVRQPIRAASREAAAR